MLLFWLACLWLDSSYPKTPCLPTNHGSVSWVILGVYCMWLFLTTWTFGVFSGLGEYLNMVVSDRMVGLFFVAQWIPPLPFVGEATQNIGCRGPIFSHGIIHWAPQILLGFGRVFLGLWAFSWVGQSFFAQNNKHTCSKVYLPGSLALDKGSDLDSSYQAMCISWFLKSFPFFPPKPGCIHGWVSEVFGLLAKDPNDRPRLEAMRFGRSGDLGCSSRIPSMGGSLFFSGRGWLFLLFCGGGLALSFFGVCVCGHLLSSWALLGGWLPVEW